MATPFHTFKTGYATSAEIGNTVLAAHQEEQKDRVHTRRPTTAVSDGTNLDVTGSLGTSQKFGRSTTGTKKLNLHFQTTNQHFHDVKVLGEKLKQKDHKKAPISEKISYLNENASLPRPRTVPGRGLPLNDLENVESLKSTTTAVHCSGAVAQNEEHIARTKALMEESNNRCREILSRPVTTGSSALRTHTRPSTTHSVYGRGNNFPSDDISHYVGDQAVQFNYAHRDPTTTVPPCGWEQPAKERAQNLDQTTTESGGDGVFRMKPRAYGHLPAVPGLGFSTTAGDHFSNDSVAVSRVEAMDPSSSQLIAGKRRKDGTLSSTYGESYKDVGPQEEVRLGKKGELNVVNGVMLVGPRMESATHVRQLNTYVDHPNSAFHTTSVNVKDSTARQSGLDYVRDTVRSTFKSTNRSTYGIRPEWSRISENS